MKSDRTKKLAPVPEESSGVEPPQAVTIAPIRQTNEELAAWFKKLLDDQDLCFDTYTHFFTRRSPFSNLYPCPKLTIDGQEFSSTEQYYAYMKAVTFNDLYAALRIESLQDPHMAKEVGKNIRRFDQQQWNRISHGVMMRANLEKYTQNVDLRMRLFRTQDTTLAECSAHDQYWGTGVSLRDPRRFDMDAWPGLNMLGRILTLLREILIQDPLYVKELKAIKHRVALSDEDE